MRYEYNIATGLTTELPDIQPEIIEEFLSVPRVVSKAQGLLELYERGLLAQIETYMTTASIPEQIAWKNIQQFEYDSPMLNTLLGTFGLTQADKDQLFVSAAARVI